MATLSPIEWEVLNATAGEVENLEQIHEHLKRARRTAMLSETADAIRSLVEEGFLAPKVDEHGLPVSEPIDPSVVWQAWFAMTPRGREAWEASKPATAIPDSGSRVYLGMFKGLIPDIPFEVFKGNRREMSRKYSEEAFDE
jgi:hypothetical protein